MKKKNVLSALFYGTFFRTFFQLYTIISEEWCLFIYKGWNKVVLTSVGVEPTNAACAPSTATSDVLNHYTIEASP